jgi:hypothetical protein
MRTYLKLILLSFVLIFGGCDKEYNEEPVPVADADLYGSWELRHVLGIQIPGISPDFPPGNGSIVKFNDNTYERYNKGNLNFSSTFRIESDKKTIDGTDYISKMVYQESGRERPVHIKISGNTLKICYGTTAADGHTETYIKQ